MARYEKGRKEATHRHIVQLASERFRKEGIDGVGVAALMADAGLTHGGFYAHFASKEALVREAVMHALHSTRAEDEIGGHVEKTLDVAAFIDDYLSASHRDRVAKGCAIAALGPDLARRPRASRAAFAEEAQRTIHRIAAGLPFAVPAANRVSAAAAVFSQLLGSLSMARLMAERTTSDAILEAGRGAARRLASLEA